MRRASGSRRPKPSEQYLAAGALPSDETNVEFIGLRQSGDSTADSLEVSNGKWFDPDGGDTAVLDQVASDRLGLDLGDSFNVPGLHPLTLTVIGIVHKPAFFAERLPPFTFPSRPSSNSPGRTIPRRFRASRST